MIVLYLIFSWLTTVVIGLTIAFLATRGADRELGLPPTKLVDFLKDFWGWFKLEWKAKDA